MNGKKLKDGSHVLELWFVFFAAVVVAYVLFNKPLLRVVLNLRPIIFGLVFMVSFSGIGAPFARLLPGRGGVHANHSRIDGFLLSSALGIGLTGLFVFLLGIFEIINIMLYSLWVLAGLASFGYTVYRHWRPLSFHINLDIKQPLNMFALLVLVPFILQLIPPLVTPAVSVDALEYHLLIPKTFLMMGKIGYIPSLVESNYPVLVEYIYLLVMPLAGDIVCKALHFWAGIFILIAMARLIARISPGSSRLLGPAFYFTMPVVVVSLGWAWNDAFFVFFMLLCLSYLLDYHLSDKTGDGTEKPRTPRFLLAAGIAAGLAAWTKYMFVMVFLALLFVFLTALVRWRWKWHHLLWFLVPTVLISLLVFAKNWAFTGNPFYPFLHGIFPSPYWNDAAASFFDKTLRNYELPDWNWSTYLSFPFHLTIKARLIDIHPGVLPLALTPLLFFRRAGRGVLFLKVFLLSNIVMWLLLRTVTRSLLLMFAVLFCVAAVELERRVWTRQAFRRPLVIFLTLALVLSLGITLVSNYYLSKPIPYFFGLESGGKFLEREARSQVVYQWLNGNSNVRNVLLVGLHGPYYLQRFSYYSSIVDPPVAELISRGVGNAEQLRKRFRRLGIGHVVVNRQRYDHQNNEGLYSWSAAQRKIFEDFISGHCTPVAKFGVETIYQVK